MGYKEVALLLVVSLSAVSCRPQNTREVLLRPFNLVRNTGGQVISTGSNAITGGPGTINNLADGAVRGVQLVPQSVNAVSDFTVNSINRVPGAVTSAPSSAFRFVNTVGGTGANVIRTAAAAPASAFTAFRQAPSTATSAIQSGTNAALS